MYGKVVDGILIYAPKNYKTNENKIIFNFNSNPTVMLQYGFKEIIDTLPEYDPAQQVAVKTGNYIETDTTITVEYEITDRPKTEEELVAEQRAILEQIILDTLDDEKALQVQMLYPNWDGNGKAYTVDERVYYNGVLYRVLQAHTSQPDWTPSAAVSLFGRVVSVVGGVIPDFVQPTGATDCYNKGDQVRYNGKIYESLIDSNVWSPTDYPAGWKEV